ncbi:hypothetical protein CPAV1605_642 [seawater metagenome]|uniref:MYM-type domain-containing protein n=1 Tax=seawater metagenome TaxID=1561972 RepID=A0A5E8CIL5_9ZZZZ
MYDSTNNSIKNTDEKADPIVPEKKKRGRKPKKKLEAAENTEPVKEKKKRGRKPKNKGSDISTKETKKRGRKPAGKIVSLNENNITASIQEDDCIITHLPIKMSDIENIENTEDLASSTQEEITTFNQDIEDCSEDYENIFIKSCDISENNMFSIENMENKTDKEKLIELERQIKDLKEVIVSLKTCSGLKSRSVRETRVNFNYIDNEEKKWEEKTDIYCWWCCHPYDTCPISLPEKVHNDTYYVFGSFCSFNCAAAYNINMDDYKIWERLSLLKSLYMKIYKKDVEITPSPPRKTLEIFGGHLSIDDFRSNILKFNKEYIYLIPPLVSMTPLIEESSKSSYSFSNANNKKFIPLYGSNNIKTSDKLSRKKPVNNAKYSLVKTMGLKKKSTKKQNEFFI